MEIELWPEASFTHIGSRIKAWISNYSHMKQWDVINNPFPNFNGGLAIIEVRT